MLQKNISLKKFNTFGIDVWAQYFATFKSIEEVSELLEIKELSTATKPLPTLVLGGGSNILFTKNFEGIVLKNEIKGLQIIKDDEDSVFVKVAGGENWHQFVLYCINNNFAGVENLSLIPGSVGASPLQNIGAYGVEIKDVFHSLEAFNLSEKKIQIFNLPDCKFGYRESVFKNQFKNQFIICSVTFKLSKKPKFNIVYGAVQQELEKMGIKNLSIKAISDAVINIRSSKLPNPMLLGNAGSFFKNPEISKNQFEHLSTQFENIVGYPLPNGNVKLAAGWLIEQCGWKGYRSGDVGCNAEQALVLVNYGNATGRQILALSQKIIDTVHKKFEVILEQEVNII